MARTGDDSGPGALNRRAWSRGGFVAAYATRELRPPEIVIFLRYRDELSRRVLDLGSGAGRLAGYLVDLGAEIHGVDLAPDMVALCRERYPHATFHQGDVSDLSRFEDGQFDAVLAAWNLLDVFSDEDRRAALREIRRVLAPGGLFVMSAHNRARIPVLRGPRHVRTSDPLRLLLDVLRVPRRMLRHRRLRRFERDEPGYAIVSDGAHDFTFVHYFITPDAQVRQLASEGFDPLEVLDRDGRPVAPGELAPGSSEVHYVSRRR